jgi:hypothetical protein
VLRQRKMRNVLLLKRMIVGNFILCATRNPCIGGMQSLYSTQTTKLFIAYVRLLRSKGRRDVRLLS